MRKLNRKLILEVLDDGEGVEETPSSSLNHTEITEGDSKNFILSLLTDLNSQALEMFNSLTPYMVTADEDTLEKGLLSNENKALLTSIYEDISLILGKLSQGIKENSLEGAQTAIDDGQTQVQNTIIGMEDSNE